METQDTLSLLWYSLDDLSLWKKTKSESTQHNIVNLQLIQLFDEINRISVFNDFYIHKDLFLYPCSSMLTIQYRQRIIKEIYDQRNIYHLLKAFIKDIKNLEKRLITVNKTKDEFKKKVFYLEMIQYFFHKIEEYQKELSNNQIADSGLKRLNLLLLQYIETDHMKMMNKSVSEYLTLLNEIFSYSLYVNKNESQKIDSCIINSQYEYKEDNFTKKLENISDFLLDSFDWTISVYQDTDITELDRQLHEKIIHLHPEVLIQTNDYYAKFREFPFYTIITAADELTFYLSYIDFMHLYEEKGFYFTLPELVVTKDIFVLGAYDLSLGINQYHKGLRNQVIPNQYEFNENDRLFILTGANQGGKTTYLKSIGMIQCLFQSGLYVPAMSAKLSVKNRIYTHFSTADDSFALTGRFEQELKEMKYILENIHENDMLLCNESFTSTQRSIAVFLLKDLIHKLNDIKCVGGFVTHFYEIVKEVSGDACVYSMVAQVDKSEISSIRTYHIMRQNPDYKAYALDIAKKCGVSFDQLMEDRIINGREASV